MAHFGVLNLNKPTHCTSRDVVDRVERLIEPTRAGHAGTLDPLATGVLVICVGQATRLIRYVQRLPKTYRATFLLGQRSDTDDLEGQVAHLEGAHAPSRAEIDRVLPNFHGEIQQRPPDYSAVKIAGRRAYKLARRGKSVELAPRPVTIHRLTVLRYEYPELRLEIECGIGTYVRSLGRDLAAALGTAAVMSALERTAIGRFMVEDAVDPGDLTAESLSSYLLRPEAAVADLPTIALTERQLAEIRHGRPVRWPASSPPGVPAPATEWAAFDPAGRLAAILFEKRAGELWPACNFLP